MNELTFLSCSVKETIDFAKKLSRLLKKGDLLGLFGDLGSGKTTFIKGLAQGLGFKNKINSPSFVILKIYKRKISFYHFDLYRLRSLKELEDIGYQDFITDSGICVIEWAQKAKELLPKHYLKIKIKIRGKTAREIKLIAYGIRYGDLIARMKTNPASCLASCFRKKAAGRRDR